MHISYLSASIGKKKSLQLPSFVSKVLLSPSVSSKNENIGSPMNSGFRKIKPGRNTSFV